MNLIEIKAIDIPDCWFQCVYELINSGHKYVVQRGSFAGETRLEFDWVTTQIRYPYNEPWDTMLPQIPTHLGIPNPVANGYIEQYLPYLMDDTRAPGEDYTYGSRIKRQVDIWVDRLRQSPNTNQAILQVAQPSDYYLGDPPCLRHIDLRIKDGKFIFFPYFRSWDLWCVDRKSEVLTSSGWKNVNTIHHTDFIASLHNNMIVYGPILGLNTSVYNGDMLRIKTKRIDQLVTPNHKILHKYISHTGSKRIIYPYSYTLAKDLTPKDGSFIPIAAPYRNSAIPTTLGVNKISLIGWILTDAYYKKNCDTIEIYQTENKYAFEIRNLLSELNLHFSEHKSTRTNNPLITFRLLARKNDLTWIRRLIPEREPTEQLLWLSFEERKALFYSMLKADGSFSEGRNKTTSWAFYSKKRFRLDWFQRLALSLGYATIINKDNGAIYISSKQESMIQRSHFENNSLPLQNYNGVIWCVSTMYNNFIMRRNNLVSVTGNSGLPANLAALAVLQKYMADEIGVEMGSMIASSKGLHLYGYAEELAKLRVRN